MDRIRKRNALRKEIEKQCRKKKVPKPKGPSQADREADTIAFNARCAMLLAQLNEEPNDAAQPAANVAVLAANAAAGSTTAVSPPVPVPDEDTPPLRIRSACDVVRSRSGTQLATGHRVNCDWRNCGDMSSDKTMIYRCKRCNLRSDADPER
jgi:hypothetical protein